MSLQVLGVSGSPIRDGNTDRAVRAILEQTGLRTLFVKLSDLDFSPCRACLGCVNSNQCVVADDARELAALFRESRALILGGYTPYGSLDARSKAFMERMYCHRHRQGGSAGKAVVSVNTTASPPGKPDRRAAAEIAQRQIAAWIEEEGLKDLGTMVLGGNVPCVRCGRGDTCPASSVKGLFGPNATVASLGINTFEEDPSLMKTAEELAGKIRRAVLAEASVDE